MKIIDQKHEIISLPKKLLTTIEKTGRVCYKSENKITKNSSIKFVQNLINRGHHAVLEFGDITVKFVTNRGVTHEIIRHRLCSYVQESTRYVKYNNEMEFIRPVWVVSGSEDEKVWIQAISYAEMKYQDLLNLGWKAQQAREVLPNSLKTEIIVKSNIREWRHIFTLRCAKNAHPQMYSLMRPLLDEFKQKLLIVFDDITY